MFPINLRIFVALALLLLFANSCNARVVDHSFVDIQPDYADIKKRQTGSCSFSPCSPSSCSGASCYLPGVFVLNTTLEDEQGDNLRLAKRRWTEDPANIGSYLQTLARRADAQNICPVTGANAGDSFCIQATFANLPTNQMTILGMGSTELTGCTVMCIVSARAVYMCHIWEDMSFVPVTTAPVPERFLGIQPFLNLISGNGGNTLGSGGPALNPALFNGGAHDNTYAFFMTPRYRFTPDDPNSQEHRNEITQLAAFVRNQIPGAAIQFYNYFASEDEYENLYQGVALFQYDPNWNSGGRANWRLWFEAAQENGVSLGQDVI